MIDDILNFLWGVGGIDPGARGIGHHRRKEGDRPLRPVETQDGYICLWFHAQGYQRFSCLAHLRNVITPRGRRPGETNFFKISRGTWTVCILALLRVK